MKVDFISTFFCLCYNYNSRGEDDEERNYIRF